MNVVIIFIALYLSIWLDAVGDALIDKNGKRNHWVEAGLILSLLGAFVAAFYGTCVPVYEYMMFYLIARVGWFNPIYNKVRGLDMFYAGSTDGIFDRWVRKAPPGLRATFHIIFGAAAILIMIDKMFSCL